MDTFDSDTEDNNNNEVLSQKGASNSNNGNTDNNNASNNNNDTDTSVKNGHSQIQASQTMPSSIDNESYNTAGNRRQDRANAPSPSSEHGRPSSPGFRLRDSPQNSPGRNNTDGFTNGSNTSGYERRSSGDRRSRSGSVTATPMSNTSRSFATPGQNVRSSGGASSIGSRTPLSQRGLRDRIPRGDLGHRSAVRSSASRRGRHGALPPISPALPTSGLGMVGPTPPSTPGSAILSEIRGVPQSALSQMSMSESNMGGAESSMNSSVGDVTSQAGNNEINHAVIWGTTINVNDAMSAFRRFLNEFRVPREKHGNGSNTVNTTSGTTTTTTTIDTTTTTTTTTTSSSSHATSDHLPSNDNNENHDDGLDEPYYFQIFAEIKMSQVYNINIDCHNLYNFQPTRKLYTQLLHYPQEIIPIMDLVVHQEFTQLYGEAELQHNRIQVRTFNLIDSRTMRDLNPSDIDQLVSVRGMIIRTSQVIPDLKQAFFRCMMCRATTEVMIDRGRIEEPTSCTNCSTRLCMQLVHNRCWFTDKQLVKLQESPEAIPEGETPTTMSLYAFDDLVDVGKPGDRVEVTGIYRAVPIRPNPKRRTVKAVYRTYIDVIHFRKTKKGQLTTENANADPSSEYHTTFAEGDEVEKITESRRRKLAALAKDPEIYNKLSHALAPSVWEMDDVKKGILLMLFGGTNKVLPNKKLRGEINILLCGDPGTSKSQLLGYVHKIAPRGMYTSGKGSSAVGLTAYISKDPETKELTLESGALVLSDRGVCCIDEFDKMSDTTRAILHEAMEQQTVSIAKAGIIATLNARTSVLASANPVESRYNPNLSVIENIRLTPTLLSRFDLIYLVLDKPNAETDRRLARHLVNLYYDIPTARKPELKKKELAEYISYARENIHPKLTNEAGDALVEGYVDMRRLGINHQTAKKVITSTPRQLESLIRLSEAHARLHFSDVVTRKDVDEAIRLMNVATHKAATDPRTGAIDMDMITTGRTALGRQEQIALAKELQNMLYAYRGANLSFFEIQQHMEEQSDKQIQDSDLEEAIGMLVDENIMTYVNMTKKYRIASNFS